MTKTNTAIATIRKTPRLIVALSGGVDSAVLLWLAVQALGRDNVVAATGTSEAVPAADVSDAERVAGQLGVRIERVPTRELQNPDYRANRGDRCFHCREELFGRLDGLAARLGIPAIAYGAIADDLGDQRPGMRSAERRGVLAPLLDAGMTKADVRAIAREAGLAVRDKPAAPCLASRIPVGTVVTAERLDRIGVAESALHGLGLRVLRVRDQHPVGRVELDDDGLRRVADPAMRRRVEQAVRRAGFAEVEIDPAGYRVGGAGTGPKRAGGQ